MRVKMEPERAKAIGRALFQKYDLGKRGMLGPKQCYEVFSDFCYRILSINPQPTMEEANSMFDVLDDNRDKVVSESDFQSLAVKYLCQGAMPSSSFGNNIAPPLQGSQASQGTYYSTYSSTKKISQTQIDTSTITKENYTVQGKNLTLIARKRIDVARRLFKMFDKDENGYLTEGEIPLIIQETYREMGQNYQPSREDVRSYMKMVDTDGDGKITLTEFEEIILRSLKNAGFEVYQ